MTTELTITLPCGTVVTWGEIQAMAAAKKEVLDRALAEGKSCDGLYTLISNEELIQLDQRERAAFDAGIRLYENYLFDREHALGIAAVKPDFNAYKESKIPATREEK